MLVGDRYVQDGLVGTMDAGDAGGKSVWCRLWKRVMVVSKCLFWGRQLGKEGR